MLIDAENVAHRHLDEIRKRIKAFGEAKVRRWQAKTGELAISEASLFPFQASILLG